MKMRLCSFCQYINFICIRSIFLGRTIHGSVSEHMHKELCVEDSKQRIALYRLYKPHCSILDNYM